MRLSLACISRSRSWDIATRVIGGGCLAFLGAAALFAIVTATRQAAATEQYARLIPTVIVNVCVFMLLLIEITLIVSRRRAIAKAGGVSPRVAALAGTWLIFLIVLLPLRVDLPTPMYVLAALLSTLGNLLAVYVVLHLGSSYSIMAEARSLVEHGPYAVVRHPLYLAEQVALLGVLITYFSWRALALCVVQSSFQFWRLRNEERVLTLTFPGYASYKIRTPMLLPWRRRVVHA